MFQLNKNSLCSKEGLPVPNFFRKTCFFDCRHFFFYRQYGSRDFYGLTAAGLTDIAVSIYFITVWSLMAIPFVPQPSFHFTNHNFFL